jgi:hypothetical protein
VKIDLREDQIPASELRLICRAGQWIPKSARNHIPQGVRGIYALLWSNRRKPKTYNVVYIGMANGSRGIRSRLNSHARSKRKGDKWTHFSFFEVWPNITESEIRELEGLFREIYRKDARANSLATQKGCRKLKDVKVNKADVIDHMLPSLMLEEE